MFARKETPASHFPKAFSHFVLADAAFALARRKPMFEG
jgi:hypothetical protein